MSELLEKSAHWMFANVKSVAFIIAPEKQVLVSVVLVKSTLPLELGPRFAPSNTALVKSWLANIAPFSTAFVKFAPTSDFAGIEEKFLLMRVCPEKSFPVAAGQFAPR